MNKEANLQAMKKIVNTKAPKTAQTTPVTKGGFSSSEFVNNLHAQGGEVAKKLAELKKADLKKFNHVADVGNFIGSMVKNNMPSDMKNQMASPNYASDIIKAINSWNQNSPWAQAIGGAADWFFHIIFRNAQPTSVEVNKDPNSVAPPPPPETDPGTCPPYYSWDASENRCRRTSCPPGWHLDINSSSENCVMDTTPPPPAETVVPVTQQPGQKTACPPGYRWNGAQCVPINMTWKEF